MQLAMADDVGGRRGRVLGQPPGGTGQVLAAELGGELRQRAKQAIHRDGHSPDLLKLTADKAGGERVQPCQR